MVYLKLVQLRPVELEPVAHRLPVCPDVVCEGWELLLLDHPLGVPQRPHLLLGRPVATRPALRQVVNILKFDSLALSSRQHYM